VNSVAFVKEPDSTKVMLSAMGDHGLEVLVYFYMDPASGLLIPSAIGQVQETIFQKFVDEGVVIPYPHSALTVDHNDKNLIGTALYEAKES
jgi:small-conductance mechanosensitive channel